jgi:hypothetical protein
MNNKALFLFLIAILFCFCDNKSQTGDASNSQAELSINVDSSSSPKPTVNVYLENSGSMDGYVRGVTEFEQTIFSYLTDLRIAGFTDSLNLFYINSIIIPYGTDLSDFIENLEPSTFRARGGNRGVTEISDIIDVVLLKTRENDVSILVTDGVFSPGIGVNAQEYLLNQQIRIRGYVALHLTRLPETAVIVYKLSSNFDGRYYNRYDTPTQINESRPYYIWIIGNAKHLNNLIVSVPKRTEKEVENVFTITNGNKKVNYAIKRGSGNFQLYKNNPKTTLTKLNREKRTNLVKFSVDANLSGFLLDDTYLLDPSNYELNNSNYQFQVNKAVSNPHGYTHTFDFTSQNVHKGTVKIMLKSKIPDWVEAVNDDVGLTSIVDKTFGIKYQIHGVYETFTFKNNYYTEISINIK